MATTFLLKRIGQSTTYPGATNTLTVSLVSTANLAGHDSSSLVITFASQGLSMTPALTDVPLQEGVVQATYANDTVSISGSLLDQVPSFVGYLFVVDNDGDEATSDDISSRNVTSHSASGLITLGSAVSGMTAGVSTYKILAGSTTCLDSTNVAWDSGAGTLTIPVKAAQTWIAGRLYVFSIVFQNPLSRRSQTTVTISSSGTATIAAESIFLDSSSIPRSSTANKARLSSAPL